MIALEDIKPGLLLSGLIPGEMVEVVAVARAGQSSLRLTYRLASGAVEEQIVYRLQESDLGLSTPEMSRPFDADGVLFRSVAEARRIQLAYLFDSRLAVHLSQIQPLPHQIEAVYGGLLPRQPLRFLLADDPGAGKTIMAGLFIKELILRGDLKRCMIVAPGSLVGQWHDELWEKFALEFHILTNGDIASAREGDPFRNHPYLICRLDQLSRSDELQQVLSDNEFDLVVVDEAHRMSAHRFGNEIKKTRRYELGELLGRVTRNLLLMTATPHAGKPEDFQLFMALLDGDRFVAGDAGDGIHVSDVQDMMRRVIKENLLRFDGTRLFPERHAYTVPYKLTPAEMSLYGAVTEYVADEMGRAERLKQQGDGRKGNRVGFAATVLQRRLASSPEAIYQSLNRRHRRLTDMLADIKAQARRKDVPSELAQSYDIELDEDLDDLDADEQEKIVDELVEGTFVEGPDDAATIAELELEIATLGRLRDLAEVVRQSGTDKKWQELSTLLQERPEMREAGGTLRKLIVFTEHKDTLSYLVRKLTAFIGQPEAVVAIHGGVGREERKAIQARFTQDPECRILVATDAAGEGINLQRAHLLVNYDLPWNPGRMEQRFGRVHRIGQEEVCHMWNLVADETREGAVYRRLLDKLNEMREALGKEQVFDVLGEALPERDLRDLLIEAIRYGNKPEVKARLVEVVDAKVGAGLAELVEQDALAREGQGVLDVDRIRAEMVEAEARRLQPGYVQFWFIDAFTRLGGRVSEREPGRFEITNVPQEMRIRDRAIGRGAPLLNRYERIVFEPSKTKVDGAPPAQLLAPGHPLLDATLDIVLERHRGLLDRGAILVDPADPGTDPKFLVFLEHSVTDARINTDGGRRVVSRRFEFASIRRDGTPEPAGYAPYVDYRPLTADEEPKVRAAIAELGWPTVATEQAALDYGIDVLAAEHTAQVRLHTGVRVEKARRAVHARLTDAARYWANRARVAQERVDAGQKVRVRPETLFERADELERRRVERLSELDREAQIAPAAPVVVGAALVIPAGLLTSLSQGSPAQPVGPEAPFHAMDRKEVERRAVDAVMATEQRLRGKPATEMPPNNPGFDIRSATPNGTPLFIEVKGRISGADTFVVTQNELRFAANVPESYILAMVDVSPDGPEKDVIRYLRRPYGADLVLPFDAVAATLDWPNYFARGSAPS